MKSEPLGFRNGERSDRMLNVLEGHFAVRVERERQFVAYLVVNAPGNADSSGLRSRLQTRGDVDTIPQKVLILEHDITQVDADAESHLAGGRQLFVAGVQG